MKLDKERIAKIKSNIEVDLEFSQEARQECKSFEPFDYDDSKWMSICSSGTVVSFDGEYFSSVKITASYCFIFYLLKFNPF